VILILILPINMLIDAKQTKMYYWYLTIQPYCKQKYTGQCYQKHWS